MTTPRHDGPDLTEAQIDATMLRVLDDTIRWAWTEAALIADQVGVTAEPGHGKKTAGEIGRRIRAMMGGTR